MARRERLYSIVGIVSLAVIFAGAGCASSEVGEPRRTSIASPSPSPSPSPAPAPAADSLADVVSLVIRPLGIELRDAAGTTVVTLSYDDPIEPTVAALNVALEAAPEVADVAGHDEGPPGVRYKWSGLTLFDSMPTDGTFPDLTNIQVGADSATTSGGVSILTQAGYKVGDSQADVAAAVGVPLSQVYYGVEFGPDLGPSDPAEPAYPAPNAWSVSVSAWESPTIVSIAAPFNFGVPGH